MFPLASLLLSAPLLAAGPGCPAGEPGATFEARFLYARECARGAYLADRPVLESVSLESLRALAQDGVPGRTAPGTRRDMVVELLEGIDAVEKLQGPAAPAAFERGRLTALARTRLGLLDDAAGARRGTATPGADLRQADAALLRAQADAAAIPVTSDPGTLAGGPSAAAKQTAAATARPDGLPGANTVRTTAPPAPTAASLRAEIEARSRDKNARLAADFEQRYDGLSLPFKDAAEYWLSRQDRDVRAGEGALGYTGRIVAASLAGPFTELMAQAEKRAQSLAYQRADPEHARRDGEKHSLKPDGYGVTIYLVGEQARHAFRDPKEGERFLGAQKPGTVRRVIFYGHGAPGLQTVGEDFVLDADGVVQLTKGKVRAGGRVDLIGCNTASIGSEGFKGPDVAGAAAYGIATLARRLTYYSMSRFSGVDKDAAEAGWDQDLARDVSARLPGVEVHGMRTFSVSLDRLIPGDDSPTPSNYVIGRQAVYLDGREVRGA